jgi:1,4-dihydroxy-2-naphthoate octaprenyltransferase
VWWRAIAALAIALAIQIGTNYANDYSDGVRGTDAVRAGPRRLVGSGLVSPAVVRRAAVISFLCAGVVGFALAAASGWWLLAVGAASVAAGWLYAGGPRPYGYLGLGELFVLVFFGLVATGGTIYVEIGTFPGAGVVAGVALGFLATALLEANNVRDVAGDTAAGKRTLAVRLGRRRAGWLYVGSLACSAVAIVLLVAWRPLALLALVAIPLALPPARLMVSGAQGRELLPALGATGRLQLLAGALLVVAFVA